MTLENVRGLYARQQKLDEKLAELDKNFNDLVSSLLTFMEATNKRFEELKEKLDDVRDIQNGYLEMVKAMRERLDKLDSSLTETNRWTHTTLATYTERLEKLEDLFETLATKP